MDFLKKHGEKILFLVLLVVLGASAFMAMNAKNNLQKIGNTSSNAGKVEITFDTERVQNLIAHLEGNAPELDVKLGAFTPQVRKNCINPEDQTLIPLEAMVCPYCGFEQTEIEVDTDGDGIIDRLELKWGMNPNDPNDVHLDQDSDGFSAIVEHNAGFDPSDSLSHPPLIDFVRLGDVEESSIDFELRGIAKLGDKFTLQLKWKYPDEDRWNTQYVKEGATFGRNNEFTVESFTEKRVQVDGKYLDQSKAVISSGSRKLTLDRKGEGRIGKLTESTANIYLLMGPEWEQDVQVNQTIELDKKSYIIVDISRTAVVLKPDLEDSEPADSVMVKEASQDELDARKPPETEQNLDMMDGAIPLDENYIF